MVTWRVPRYMTFFGLQWDDHSEKHMCAWSQGSDKYFFFKHFLSSFLPRWVQLTESRHRQHHSSCQGLRSRFKLQVLHWTKKIHQRIPHKHPPFSHQQQSIGIHFQVNWLCSKQRYLLAPTETWPVCSSAVQQCKCGNYVLLLNNWLVLQMQIFTQFSGLHTKLKGNKQSHATINQ